MSKDNHTWQKADWITAAVAALISFAVYVWSAAPNVTLLDSGEFIVAAQHFGVPHPTGYPVWTFLTWLFQLLPLGNAAWEVAIFSGLCAAIAVGFAAALLANLQTWCMEKHLPGRLRFLPHIVALAFSLMLAFSQSMWSQAVIAEVYALHALLIALFLYACYSWVRNPARDGMMLFAFFLLALSFSNHQLTMILAGLPYLLILLLRRRCFLDWLMAGILTVLLGYLVFAILSKDPLVLKTALRFTYVVAVIFGAFLWVKKFRVRWKFIAFLPFAVGAGLFPHVYMPLASMTNPPMNWGYTRDADGFFFSFNRSQYPGSLSDVTINSLGKLMGTAPAPKPKAAQQPGDFTKLQKAQMWIGFFWQKMITAFSIVSLFGYFASVLFVFRMSLSRRVWVYFLHIAFVLAAFLQPVVASTKIDNADWWTQMPYHTYTNLIYAVLSGLGLGLILQKLSARRPAAFWLSPLLLILPIFTFMSSESSSNQRDRWFGWMFGHDMLKDLPKGSIMIGGTDPGRFVPTYMIFGESPQPAKDKRDPDFDRRDLYIITQNALGEPQYMKYLRDHYTTARPEPKNFFERWLGRADTYPKDPIILPNEKEVEEIIKKGAEELKASGATSDNGTLVFSSVLKWIWEQNRDKHDFFIEESFPITWTYDYATPNGLSYQLNKEKVESLTPEMVEKDFSFWKDYKRKLLDDPEFGNDLDAQRSFSKLRQTMANIYRYRKMDREAERAMFETLELWPGNLEALVGLGAYLAEKGEFDTLLKLYDNAIALDPNSLDLWKFREITVRRQEAEGQINEAAARLAEQPKSRDALKKLIELYSFVGETNKAQPLVDRGVKDFPDDTDLLRFFMTYHQRNNSMALTYPIAKRLTELESSNVQNFLLLSQASFLANKKPEFYEAATRAIELGGTPVLEAYQTEQMFGPWRNDAEYKKLIDTQPKLGN